MAIDLFDRIVTLNFLSVFYRQLKRFSKMAEPYFANDSAMGFDSIFYGIAGVQGLF